ncbi:hypothetical protein [Pandoraea sputorum]|uniref:Uncharacterized protein n=1 Tax=Pandoraea sputorum TaxID=93222 RepID=A0A5E5BL51_9BURK|nr:hypothetical protein [Pandoraea sputorum]VVE86006.1 hypothetical protein PSP31121_05645 [Pandoraea sputorum]
MPLDSVIRTCSPTKGTQLDHVFLTKARFGLTTEAAASQTMEELYFARDGKPAPIALTVGGKGCDELIGRGPFQPGGRGAELLKCLRTQFYEAFVKAKVPPDVAVVQAFDAACQLGRQPFVEVDHLLEKESLPQTRYRQALAVSLEDNAVCLHKTTTYRAPQDRATGTGVDPTTQVVDIAMLLTGTSQALEVTVNHVTVRVADSVASPAPQELLDAAQEHSRGGQAQSGFLSRLIAALSALFSREPNIKFVQGTASEFTRTDPQAAARPREISLENLGLEHASDDDFWVVSASKAGFAGVDWAWNNTVASYGVKGAHVVRKDGAVVDPATQRGAFHAFGDTIAERKAGELDRGNQLHIGGLALGLRGTPLPPDTYSFGTEHVAAKLENADWDDKPLETELRATLDAALFPPAGVKRHQITINGEPIAVITDASRKDSDIDEAIRQIGEAFRDDRGLRRQVFAAIISGRAGMDIVSRGNGMPQFKDNANETCSIDIWTPQAASAHAPPPGEAKVHFSVKQGKALSEGTRVTLGSKSFDKQQFAKAKMETLASYSLSAQGPKLTVLLCDGHLKPAPRAASTLRSGQNYA